MHPLDSLYRDGRISSSVPAITWWKEVLGTYEWNTKASGIYCLWWKHLHKRLISCFPWVAASCGSAFASSLRKKTNKCDMNHFVASDSGMIRCGCASKTAGIKSTAPGCLLFVFFDRVIGKTAQDRVWLWVWWNTTSETSCFFFSFPYIPYIASVSSPP